MNTDKNISIIGGGAAGLASAYFAHRYELPYQCYEASSELGGNARTIWRKVNGEDFGWDTGAHRLHGVHDGSMEIFKSILGEEIHQIHSKSKMCFQDSYLDFPFSPKDFLRNVGLAKGGSFLLEFLLASLFKKTKTDHFENYMRSNFGNAIAENFFLNYSEKLWGLPCDQLSTAISGSRLKKWTILDVIQETVGLNKKHLEGSFYYPTKGIGDIWDKLLVSIKQNYIHTNTPVQQIIHNGKRVTELQLSRHSVIVNNLISTIDLKTFINLLRPAVPDNILEYSSQITYRNLRLAIIYLDQPHFSKFPSLYFPENQYSFTRIYEPKIRSQALAPKDKTAIVIESPCNGVKSPDFLDEITEELIRHKIVSPKKIISKEELFLPNAYPVLNNACEKALQGIANYLKQFENLELCGRSSEFKYCHIHDHFDNSQRIIKKISEKTI